MIKLLSGQMSYSGKSGFTDVRNWKGGDLYEARYCNGLNFEILFRIRLFKVLGG